MQVTTKAMRQAVTGWLREERATKEQTLQLLEAVHAGAIDGCHYAGRRIAVGESEELLDSTDVADDILPWEEAESEPNQECGCLLDTFERIQGGRRVGGTLQGAPGTAFALAVRIPLGATPENNAFARAAARGIEDYYAAKGWR